MPDRLPDSPYGIICDDHGKQGLSPEEYNAQMNEANSLWRCPITGCISRVYWDDDRYDTAYTKGEV